MRDGNVFWALWHMTAFLFVVLAPIQLRLGQPFWTLPAPENMQALVMGAAYLLLALFLGAWAAPRPGVLIAVAIAGSLGCFGAGLLFLASRPDIEYSRLMVLASAAVGTVLAILPSVLGRSRIVGLGMLAAGLTGVVAGGVYQRSEESEGPHHTVVRTALNAVAMTYHRGLVGALPVDGGAIARDGDTFLLATGSGEFYRLAWAAEASDSVRSERLALPPPMDRKAFLADQPDPARAPRLRVTDVAIAHQPGSARIYVAHQHWNHDSQCLTMRVSRAPFPDPELDAGGRFSGWETIFESRPCVPVTPMLHDLETGGILAWDGKGGLLLTLGDHGFVGRSGTPAVAQSTDADYGKVLLLDQAGGREIFTMGHRNPQGLVVDRQGRIWEAEHGPQGGDELNLLEQGGNYGWPSVTYGTDYGRTYWPFARPQDQNPFQNPVHAFVPSVAVSSLLEVTGEMFPEWEGDLLVGSLRGQNLFRLRLAGTRVAYVEPIGIQRRIRDLAQGNDGRILLWTDEGDLVVLSRTSAPRGETVYQWQCRNCHEPRYGRVSLGPDLRGVVGRAIASQEDFEYSAELRRVEGAWTEDRLDAFLREGATFAPGTTMDFEGLREPEERRVLIEFLKGYR